MSSLFPDLREELVGAMARGPRYDRRRPVALVLAVAAIVAIATVARPHTRAARPAITPAPTPALPPAIARDIRLDGDAGPVVHLRVADETGLEWDAATWATPEETMSLTVAAAGARDSLGAAGWGTFSIAKQLLASPLAGARLDAAVKDGRPRYVVIGLAESRATSVVVSLDGQRRQATLSQARLATDVSPPPPEASAKLRRVVPERLTLKLFAVAFSPPHAPSTRTLRPRIAITRPDGTTSTQDGARYCVSRRCGQPPTPLR